MTYRLRRFLLAPTGLHLLCALCALLACLPPLFPELCPQGTEAQVFRYAGYTLMSALIVSGVLMLLSGAAHLLRFNNLRALTQLLKWGSIWGGALGVFAFTAFLADVPAQEAKAEHTPIQTSDTLHPPHDALTGPDALTIPIDTTDAPTDNVVATPNLTLLENKHAELLRTYLERSPRWQGLQTSDTFYSRPGHPVLVPPTASGTPGLVHVCFRHLTEGAPLPEGYTVIKPGDPFPVTESDTQVADLALDLGRNHYLLLAWRGTAHAETAYKALNAAIAAIDRRMQPLVEHPEEETITRMLTGRRSYTGDAPEIRFCEPAGQEGVYQAEVYVNPGEEGTLLFYIRESESGELLRLFSCPAQYSDQSEELFRHDIPGSVPSWSYNRALYPYLPPNAPVFTIRNGSDHRYFGVALEVWFKPADQRRHRYRLLRRCYKVLPFDDSFMSESPVSGAASPVDTEEKDGADVSCPHFPA